MQYQNHLWFKCQPINMNINQLGHHSAKKGHNEIYIENIWNNKLQKAIYKYKYYSFHRKDGMVHEFHSGFTGGATKLSTGRIDQLPSASCHGSGWISWHFTMIHPGCISIHKGDTPLKIHMEHNHGGLEDQFLFFSWVMAVGSSR